MLVWLSDLRLNAELTGPEAAPPLVLIHGLGLDLTLWDALLPHLPTRTLRLDLRGHGASDAPPPPYALGTLIRDAEYAARLGPRWATSPALDATRTMLARTRPEGWQGLAAALATADLYQTTATLTLPTLVLAGADDRKTPPDLQRELADLIAGSTFQLLPGASHLAMLTHPDAFASALLHFLTRIGHD